MFAMQHKMAERMLVEQAKWAEEMRKNVMEKVDSALHKLSCKLIGEARQFVDGTLAKLADELCRIESDGESNRDASQVRDVARAARRSEMVAKQRAVWFDATRKIDDALERVSAFLAERVS